jgi:hypothetical protein
MCGAILSDQKGWRLAPEPFPASDEIWDNSVVEPVKENFNVNKRVRQ